MIFRSIHSFRTGFWILTACLSVMLFGGCSTFHRDWKQAVSLTNEDSLEGAWKGDWESGKNGHHGKLKCILSPIDGSSDYRARYRAHYFAILRFEHSARLSLSAVEDAAQPSKSSYNIQGEADLGRLAGGVYRYEGKIINGSFEMEYRSSYDHG
ncbi:MAG TPA: hypothetical protein EYG38_21300, partial [Verrucomicrobia bacterium]|nr:hypothetical protein [Verrucomicrobiota bacterium]